MKALEGRGVHCFVLFVRQYEICSKRLFYQIFFDFQHETLIPLLSALSTRVRLFLNEHHHETGIGRDGNISSGGSL